MVRSWVSTGPAFELDMSSFGVNHLLIEIHSEIIAAFVADKESHVDGISVDHSSDCVLDLSLEFRSTTVLKLQK